MIEKLIGGKVEIKFEKKNERIKIVKEDDIKKHTNLKKNPTLKNLMTISLFNFFEFPQYSNEIFFRAPFTILRSAFVVVYSRTH